MIAHYESDSTTPPVEVLGKLAEALSVTVSYLLGESAQKRIDAGIKPSLRKHLDALEALPPRDQKKVMEYADLLGKANE
jgi:transcriptional regulator with XRE-family HTH domain